MQQPAKLFNKNYVLLWQGQFVSKIGSQLFLLASVLWIKRATESASMLGLIGAVSSIVAISLGPLSGTFADRHSRKWIIVITDFFNGVVVIGLAAVAFFWPQNTNLIVVVIIVTLGLNAALSSFFGPAISASIPDIVPNEKLSAANSLGQFSTQISSLFGKGLGGVLFTIMGAPVLFFINGLSYIFSAISEYFITIPQEIPERKNGKEEIQKFKKDLVEGFHFIWHKKGLKQLVLLSALMSFFTTPIILLLPFFVEDFLMVGDQWYGFIMAGYGLGALVGYLMAAVVRVEKRKRAIVLIACMVLEASSYGILGFIRSPLLATSLATVAGVINGYIMVNITTILQVTTPSKIRGRVFGVLTTLVGSITPIAMSLSGIVADLVNQNIPLIYMTCSGIMVFIALILASMRDFREFLIYDMKGEKLDLEVPKESLGVEPPSIL
ncbi:MAG: MFS transporter [Actinobacteria bacterium]|nr:MFS transporter [Actinomycetota bacterium]